MGPAIADVFSEEVVTDTRDLKPVNAAAALIAETDGHTSEAGEQFFDMALGDQASYRATREHWPQARLRR
jgi:hypothetical protein